MTIRFERSALLKLEGYTNNEIADQLQCSPGTIEANYRESERIGNVSNEK